MSLHNNIELEPLELPSNLNTVLTNAYNKPLTTTASNDDDIRRQWEYATSMFIKTKQKIEKTDKQLLELIEKRKKLERDALKYKDILNRLDPVIISDIYKRRNTIPI